MGIFVGLLRVACSPSLSPGIVGCTHPIVDFELPTREYWIDRPLGRFILWRSIFPVIREVCMHPYIVIIDWGGIVIGIKVCMWIYGCMWTVR